MRHARYMLNSRIENGTVTPEGQLLGPNGRPVDEAAITWLPPVTPTKILGLALNFADHAAELNKVDLPTSMNPTAPVLFFKPLTSLNGHRGPVVAPPNIEYMHYEAELAVVIGRAGRRIKRGEAYDYVKGYTVANDVTIRDFVQNMYRPPVKAKCWDTFTPLGPWWVDRDDIANPDDVNLRTYVNGELRQQGNTQNFVHDIPAILEFITEFMTLEENDLILTGTPEGLSHLYPGDVMRVEIDGIGALENPVVGEE
jgi:5-oxopent-3-ene-1,2,5-tricarboxylate decarboxylase/2-hydroxyhepta-2,4-diene-1,7-dioate isomerase